MSSQTDLSPIARLDFVATGNRRPGWYVRYEVYGRPASERLPIEIGADAFGAISEAAEYLGCRVDQIEFGGPIWPMPLDGHVESDETLEFVTEPSPEIEEDVEDDTGEWQLVTQPEPIQEARPRVEARRFPRRKAEGVLLYGPVYGQVLDWSEAGMGIEIGQPLEVASRKLFLAKGDHSKIELHGEVRWCRMIHDAAFGDSPTYHAGIQLVG